MTHRLLSSRFLETTPGRMVTLLHKGEHSVDELATGLGVSGTAVRGHLAALERDGLVRGAGQRPGRRKPTQLYALTVRADHALSTAYIPVLRGLLAVLSVRLSPAAFTRLLGVVGRRLAAGRLPTTADRRARAEAAAKVLNELGGAVRVEQRDGQLVLQSAGCPLAELVRDEPGACRIVESLVTELVGVQAREVCERGERPRCAFVLDSSPPRVKRRR